MHAQQRIIGKIESVKPIRGGELKIVEEFVYVKKHNLAGGGVLSNVRHGGIAMVPQGNGTAKLKVRHHRSLILPKQRLIEQEPGFRQTFPCFDSIENYRYVYQATTYG